MASVPPQGGRKHPNQDFLQIDTTNILFICGGAFDGLEKVIQNRSEKSGIGFGATVHSKSEKRGLGDLPRGRARRPDQVRPDPRAGRPPAGGRHARRADRGRAGADPHRAEERAGQAVPEAVRDGRRRARDPAVGAGGDRASKALARKTGARGLRSIMEQSLIDTMFDLPNARRRGQGGGRRAHHRRRRQAAARLPRAGQGQRLMRGCPPPIGQVPVRPLLPIPCNRPRASHRPEKERYSQCPDIPYCPAEPITLPLLPLRDVVVFPHMVIPLFVGRPKSIKALEAAMEAGRQIMLVAQKAAGKDEPKPDDMFEVGCVSSILQMLKLPDGTVKVLVEGIQRATTHCDHRQRRALRRRSDAGAARGRGQERGRGAAPRGDAAVRPVRQAEQEDPAGDPDLASPASTTPAAWPTRSPRTCR